jgi:hypothetical protein
VSFDGERKTWQEKVLSDEWLQYRLDEEPLLNFAEKWLSPLRGPKILIWNRARNDYEKVRDTSPRLLSQLTQLVRTKGFNPVLFGHPVKNAPRLSCNLTEIWNEPGIGSHLEQLRFVEHIRRHFDVVGSIGNRSGGMDGPALLGMPTLYLEERDAEHQARMFDWTRCMFNYRRVFLDGHEIPDGSTTKQTWLSTSNARNVSRWLDVLRKCAGRSAPRP